MGCAWAGDLVRAADLVEGAREREFQTPYNPITWLHAHFLWADSVHIVGDAVAAAILCPRPDLVPTSHASLGPPTAHSAGILRATMGGLDIAIQHLQHAIEKARGMQCAWMAAQSEVALAEVLTERRTSDDIERARTLAVPALTLAQEHGYGYIQRDARAVLEQLG